MKKLFKNFSFFKTILFALLVIYSLSLLIPLFWGAIASLKSVDEFRLNILGFPEQVTFENFEHVINRFVVITPSRDGRMKTIYVETMIFNSIIYVIGISFFASLMPFLTAYLTAKFPGKLASTINVIVIIALALPIVGATPSELELLMNLKLYDTFAGVFILRSTFLSVYYLVFYSMFKGLSQDFAEAAALDGASELRTMLQIIMPIAKSTFLAVFLVHFISYWNDYQAPLLYIPSHITLSYGLYFLSTTTENGLGYVPMRMTGVILVVIPILVLYMIFRKKIMNNVSLGGSKE